MTVSAGADAEALPAVLGYQGLAETGVSRHHFEQLVAEGFYERFAPGVFVRAGLTDDTTATWMAIATRKPRATLCLLSALSIHDLTDEIPRETNVAIPTGTQTMKTLQAPVAWHRFDPDTFGIGRTEHLLPGGVSIGLYSPERTIIDVFRLRHAWGSDLAVGALKRWLSVRGNSPSAILTMAREFPKAHPELQRTLEVLL
jgi:predicted transcriptional regulator of viral defense system